MPERIALLTRARSAAFFEGFVNSFLKKVGEFIKKESQKPHKIRIRDSESLSGKIGGLSECSIFRLRITWKLILSYRCLGGSSSSAPGGRMF